MWRVLVAVLCGLSGGPIHAQEAGPPTDVILDTADAPHELVIYFAPGCPPCLELYRDTFADVRETYVEPGKLRVVFRAIPFIFAQRGLSQDDPTYVRARRLSLQLGFNLRCRLHNEGVEAYIYALETQITLMNRMPGPTWRNWPYISEDEEQSFVNGMKSDGAINGEEFTACVTPPLYDEFRAAFEHNTDLLRSETSAQSVPVYVLNGTIITAENPRLPPPVLETLANVIEEPVQ